MTQGTVTVENLDSVMEFRQVVQVHPDGTVADGNSRYGMFAPILTMLVDADGQRIHTNDEGIISQARFAGWKLVTGFSGKYGYHGAIMPTSDSIGGNMARAILETPGYYVKLAVNREITEDTYEPAGWVVVYWNS